MTDVVLYATDTMADWEYSYLTAGLAMAAEQDPDRFQLRVLADAQEEVTTKGRLRLSTDGDLDDVSLEDVALLVLPGADTWSDGHRRVLDLARVLLERHTPVAGICGATYGLARAGLLDDRAHTSNALDFLVPSGYAGAGRYRDERVVVDGDVITAPATAPVDFAAAVFRRLELFPPATIDAWYGLYTTGERRWFDALSGPSAA
ncbi:DJ-1/PfpI family protein [Geodermatophilus sp. URMC 61]|uniref:DJ-1/PfpI family protein n=1 Tax=Geodermatophilus sp. URMC 61 TaxID=3423411 RepID=UPI00406D0A7D